MELVYEGEIVPKEIVDYCKEIKHGMIFMSQMLEDSHQKNTSHHILHEIAVNPDTCEDALWHIICHRNASVVTIQRIFERDDLSDEIIARSIRRMHKCQRLAFCFREIKERANCKIFDLITDAELEVCVLADREPDPCYLHLPRA